MNKTEKLVDTIHLDLCEKYREITYRKMLGEVHLKIKEQHVNSDLLKTKKCKGKQNRKLSHHQICQGASCYAMKFHILEGYTIDYAIIKACLMWNMVNECDYFTCTLPKKKNNILCDYVDNTDVIGKMCRIHHRKANLELLKGITYASKSCKNVKLRPKTYWMCFQEALQYLSKDDLVTMASIKECLRTWNEDNNIELFNLS